MKLKDQTLSKLRDLINEETRYRKGPELVLFFNKLGFQDVYRPGFPSRGAYTLERLSQINGTPEIDKCIKNIFDPIEYINRYSDLDKLIQGFNEYLSFDGWKVVRNNAEINIRKNLTLNIDEKIREELCSTEDSFIRQQYVINLDGLKLLPSLFHIIETRIDEIGKCIETECSLAAIFLSGSTIEGILLNVASNHPQKFNQSNSAPKNKEGKVKPFHEWSLNNFIDVSFDLGVLKLDVYKYSHVLRDFRNFIHPYEQMSKNFSPDIHTATISFQVLKAAICQIEQFEKRI